MPVSRRASRAPPPPAASRAASPPQDKRCGNGPWRGQLRRSASRVATTSAGVAPFAGAQKPPVKVRASGHHREVSNQLGQERLCGVCGGCCVVVVVVVVVVLKPL